MFVKIFDLLIKQLKRLFFYLTQLLNKNLKLVNTPPGELEDSEELTRRCKERAIRKDGSIRQDAFCFGHPNISVDRSKYRSYEDTVKAGPTNIRWLLVKGIVREIRNVNGVNEVSSNPVQDNPAHAFNKMRNGFPKKTKLQKIFLKKFKKVEEIN